MKKILVIALLTIAALIVAIIGTLYWLAPATPTSANVPPPPVESVLSGDPGREDCRHYNPQRQPFFGDLHVHTAYSLDANMKGLRAGPDVAYRYALGEPVGLPPYDEDGRPLNIQQIGRPLDFAAVTDHAELLGETRICRTPGVAGYNSLTCRVYRLTDGRTGQFINLQGAVGAHLPFCGPDGEHCREEGLVPWRDTQRAAEAVYDRSSDCGFTSFVGYEWTAGPFLSDPPRAVNLHRNVIFRNDVVPRHPISTDEALKAGDLWRQLDASCTQARTTDARW
ncbi:MAG: DUF3604 domain-containing protein [Halioglobus sp.]|nr:DUF3604 domain-containing protein [Halioglobus sp.]